MSYTAQYLLFDTPTSNLLSSQWFLFIFWKKNWKHNWKTLISLQRIMSWASVLLTLFIYFPCFLSPFVSPIVPLNSSLIPYQPPIIFLSIFPLSPIFLQHPPDLLSYPDPTPLTFPLTSPPRPKSSPRTSILPPAPALLIFPFPPLPHHLSLPRLLGIAFKTVDSVAYSNPTNTETTSAHKISVSFSISVLHDKASMGLLKQHFR